MKKFRRTKLPKFRLGAEILSAQKFCPPKFCPIRKVHPRECLYPRKFIPIKYWENPVLASNSLLWVKLKMNNYFEIENSKKYQECEAGKRPKFLLNMTATDGLKLWKPLYEPRVNFFLRFSHTFIQIVQKAKIHQIRKPIQILNHTKN